MFLQWFLADEESENKFLQVVEKLLQPVKAFLKLVPYSTVCNVQKTFLWAVNAICLLDKLLDLILKLHFKTHPSQYMIVVKNAVHQGVNFSNMNTKIIRDYIGSIHLFLRDLALNKAPVQPL